MAEIEMEGILDEIQSIVSDKLQVVSYKWLSRNFLVSSNAAKSLLEEFIEKYGNGLEVIYSLSGWLKNNPSTYHVKLVSKHKLSDVKQEFDGNYSIQVYSVQACLPKDSATLWNQEFVQAEDLFKQPQAIDNCLRDNRFCGVSNPFIKRNAGENPSGTGIPKVEGTGVSGLSKINSATVVPLPQPNKIQQPSPKVQQSSDITKKAKNGIDVKLEQERGAQNQEKASHVPPNNKKGQMDKNASGTGGALANMWGRASAKSKPDTSLASFNNSKQNFSAGAEAQISAHESIKYESSDEDAQDFNVKRASNGEGGRKRRVVFDYSDEEDDYQNTVNLASPDPPKISTPSLKASGLECNLSFEDNEDKQKINKMNDSDLKVNQNFGEKVSTTNKGKQIEPPISEKTLSHVPETNADMKEKVADAMPKRRKLLKTKIDERGREVTEVVWEGQETDKKSDNNNSARAADSNTANSLVNRHPLARKSPAVGNSSSANPSGKAGSKKAGSKDPKQGNILSFFKKF